MKIAFTTTGADLAAPMDERFGRAPNFLIYDTGNKTFVLVPNSYRTAGQGAGVKAAETVARAGAGVVVTGDCGPKAYNALKQAGVKIFSSKSTSVAEALERFLQGGLKEITAV